MKFASLLSLTSLLFAQAPVRIQGSCTPDIVHEIGLDCSQETPCPIFLELSAVEMVGNRLLVSGNLHTAVTTLESIMLASEDTGRTWTEVHPRLPQSSIEAIQFLDYEVGWASGQVLHPRPRDAFFLLTSDGGKSWRRRPLFSETRTGTVEAFRFDSRSHGRLLIDRLSGSENGLRYELWESMTGGEGWDVRQVDSKPIALNVPARAESWRIKPDAAAKVLWLEQKSETRWQNIAAFAIAAGECKPVPPEPKTELEPQSEPPPSVKPSLKRKNEGKTLDKSLN
ncbi:MAG: hypothetical protein WKF37_08380 [Bryobacteraceae bacterium]